MLALHIKKTRLNVNTPFYFQLKHGTVFLLKYLHDNYQKDKKIKNTPWVFSEDGLTATTTTYFQAENDYTEWSSDVIVVEHMLDPLSIYEEENDILSEIIGEEIL
jgi:hypothetical protein